jgi:ectoine hydroxylase-related dioxygenase (phytanoyl-CoA dioxygenase family)
MRHIENIEQFGFEITPAVFSQAECDSLIEELSVLETKRTRAGARHLMSHPFVARIANDERVRGIAAAVLGPGALPYRATLFDKSAESNWSVVWHQDTALPLETRREAVGWGPWSTKGGIHYAHAPTAALVRVIAIRVHLDDCVATNGPLRVIPGSHRLGVLCDEEVLEVAHASEPKECLVARGGILTMRPLVIHSSSRVKSRAQRRVFHIEYAAELEIQPDFVLAAA